MQLPAGVRVLALASLSWATCFGQAAPVRFTTLRVEGSCAVAQPSALVIRSNDEWRTFLRERLEYQGAPPAVDFQTTLVVALFGGEQLTGGYSLRVTRAVLQSAPSEPEKLVIHHRLVPPPRSALVTEALSYPYLLILVRSQARRVEFRPALTVCDRPECAATP